MLPEQRKREILSIIKQEGAISVAQLCEMFDISTTTVRKDLAELEQRGLIIRSHGGALALNYGRSDEVSIEHRKSLLAIEKEYIANAASEYVRPGQAIYLDGSSTVISLAKKIVGIEPLTVVTNSLNVMNELAEAKGIKIISLGGVLDHLSRCFIGPDVEENLSKLRVDGAFISTKGISVEDGLSDAQLPEARLHRKVLQITNKAYLLMDSSKFDLVCFAVVADLEQVDYLITDKAPPQHFRQALKQANVDLIVTNN
ncbi:MAG TPA: DeoR/GlpR transcriptional regulator [Firmicutes bacterium]|nr:DeoR/GlpR transcriptional regulator [Bacillota bacterium]